jgi:hypothetical protein
MNERIKELAEEAREYATTQHPVSNIALSVNSEMFEQKFAELIVRESIVDFYRRYLDLESEEDITKQVNRYVKDTLELNNERTD